MDQYYLSKKALKMWWLRGLLVLVTLGSIITEAEADIKVGAFNIQIFGRRKAANADVMATLVQIVRQYDILFIQEIRDSSGTAIAQLLAAVNRKQSVDKLFSMKISKRLGRSNSKEQYAFLFRTGAGIQLLGDYTYTDARDDFEREPMICKFTYNGFEFAIVGIHIDPDKAVSELNALDVVIKDVKRNGHIDNVLIMGDLNADCSYVPKYRWKEIRLRQNTAEYRWYIGDGVDTTIKKTHCAYDRIITYGPLWKNSIVENSIKVNRFHEELGLTLIEATRVSDHFPVELKIRAPSRQMRIPNVYIYLTNPLRSLTKGRIYTMRKIMDRSKMGVFDGDVQVGTVRLDTNLALYELISQPGTVMTVKPVRYRYRGKQRADVYITLPN